MGDIELINCYLKWSLQVLSFNSCFRSHMPFDLSISVAGRFVRVRVWFYFGYMELHLVNVVFA